MENISCQHTQTLTLQGVTFKFAGNSVDTLTASFQYVSHCFEDVVQESPDIMLQPALALTAMRLAEMLHLLHLKQTEECQQQDERVLRMLSDLVAFIDEKPMPNT